MTEQLFRRSADVLATESRRFDHILIDEYQDTNDPQYQIMKAMAHHRNLCVVGDDDQSIYGFRGAEVEHILSFKHDWPEAKVIRLEDNYRSTEQIIAVANSLIKFNSLRHDKVLRAARPNGEKPRVLQHKTEAAEAKAIVAEIGKRIAAVGRLHREPHDFAILFRTNEQPRVFETELRSARLPYVLVGGQSFFDRKEVKDVLAYLRLTDRNPDDVSILRVINTPNRGVGKRSIERLVNHSIAEKVPLWDLVTGRATRPELPSRAIRGLEALVRCIDAVQYETPAPLNDDDELNRTTDDADDVAEIFTLSNDPPKRSPILNDKQSRRRCSSLVDIARRLIAATNYRFEIDRNYDEQEERESRWESVEQVVNALAEYEQSAERPRLGDFLDKLPLGEQEVGNDKEKQLGKNAIALMTIHSAKGLEFPEVYLVGMEEGILPHHRSIDTDDVDEERRLCYVGVTRAEERLTLSMSQTRMKWGKPRGSDPSRFLYELIGQTDHPNYFKSRRA